MRLALTEDQIAFRDAVRDLLRDRAEAPPETLWSALTELGVTGAAVDSGLSSVDFVPLLEEIGYAAVPLPLAETAFVAVPLLAEVADARLDDVVKGRLRIAVAVSGTVLYGQRADLVLDLTDARLGPATGVALSTVDEALHALGWEPAGAVLTNDSGLVEAARRRAELARAAELVGLGRRMLDMTVAYVKQRQQFGKPIGSFQAVKHQLADALLGLEFAAPAVLAAGWALDRGDDPERDVAAAGLLAAEAAYAASRAAIQCHGAIGYTVEYELHRFAKRAWALGAITGTGADLDRLARRLEEER